MQYLIEATSLTPSSRLTPLSVEVLKVIPPRCTPYFHWAGIREYGDYCRGKALKCMNDVFTRIGEFQEVDDDSEEHNTDHSNQSSEEKGAKYAARRKCLAACQDQVFYMPMPQCLHCGFMEFFLDFLISI